MRWFRLLTRVFRRPQERTRISTWGHRESGCFRPSFFGIGEDATVVSHNSGFWVGGSTDYQKALSEQESRLLQPLQNALEKESDPEMKRRLTEQIEAIRAEFREKRGDTRWSLFWKS